MSEPSYCCGRHHHENNCPACGRPARYLVINPSEPADSPLRTYAHATITVNGVPLAEAESVTFRSAGPRRRRK